MKNIISTTNPVVKLLASLHTKDGRQEHGLCLAEGERTIETFLQSRLVLEMLYVIDAYAQWAQDRLVDEKITLVSEQVMKKISTATTPSGIIGVFKIPQNPQKNLQRGIVLANIQDPGNMGTLIRTAVALATPTIVVIEGTDPWSPKVIQSSAGTVAHATLHQLTWEELVRAKKVAQLNLVALVISNGNPLETTVHENSLLVVGNEARGLPTLWQEQCDAHATLPMPGNTESLNAAVAGSIALYVMAGKMGILKKT